MYHQYIPQISHKIYFDILLRLFLRVAICLYNSIIFQVLNSGIFNINSSNSLTSFLLKFGILIFIKIFTFFLISSTSSEDIDSSSSTHQL